MFGNFFTRGVGPDDFLKPTMLSNVALCSAGAVAELDFVNVRRR